METKIQSVLCVNVSISVVFMEQGGFPALNKGSQAQLCVAAEEGESQLGQDQQIRTVCVPPPIHEHM